MVWESGTSLNIAAMGGLESLTFNDGVCSAGCGTMDEEEKG